MNEIVFGNKSKKPDLGDLLQSFGDSANLWKKAEAWLNTEVGKIEFDWKFYGKSSGWTMKILKGKRNLFFLLPRHGCIRLAFIFGEKAYQEIINSDFPESLKLSLSEARVYAEGRGLHVEIHSDSDFEVFQKLIQVKTKF